MVRKEGPNQGREFFTCDENCNFFSWAEEARQTQQQQQPSTGASARNQPQNPNQSRASNNAVPNCECHVNGTLLTVRKEGPNKDRQFYKCGNEGKCNFFQWADEEPRSNSGASSSGAKCNCNVNGLLLTVRKDGPNKDRQFYKCGNNNSCNFFQWADEQPVTSNMRQQDSNANRGGKGGNSGGGKRKPPTCSNCGQVGHTKRGCKNK